MIEVSATDYEYDNELYRTLINAYHKQADIIMYIHVCDAEAHTLSFSSS